MNRKKILLATTDPECVKFLRRNLETYAEVVAVEDGHSALSYIVNEIPDMIIVDSDLELIRWQKLFHILKNNPRTQAVPFLLIQTVADGDEVFQEQIDDYLKKPFRIPEVQNKVLSILFREEGPVSFAVDSKKDDDVLQEIRDLRTRVRKKVEQQLLQDKEEAEREGKFPWEGFWLTAEKIGKVQDRLKRKDRVVFMEVLFLFFVMAVFCVFFLGLVTSFLPSENTKIPTMLIKGTSLPQSDQPERQKVQTIGQPESLPENSEIVNTAHRNREDKTQEHPVYPKGKVHASELKIREGPGTRYAVMEMVHQGDILTIHDRDGVWLDVITDQSIEGWVSGEYVDIND